MKDGNNLFITFAGSHDQTDRWIDTHRYDAFCEDDRLYITEIIESTETLSTDEPLEDLPSDSFLEPDEFIEQLIDKIDDAMLKMVFSGLFNN